MKDSSQRARIKLDGAAGAPLVRATSFQTITFFDPELKKQVIMLYALGADGIVREYSGGKWNSFPISKS